jgi:REP element-mobilizing transposase RayT
MYEHHIQFFTATILEWKYLLKQDNYKDILIESMKFLVEQSRAKIYGFVIMPNHIHLIWLIDEKYEREAVQRDFLKFTAQRIMADLKDKYPAVLKKFEVNSKDRKHQIWERNPLSIDIYSREVLIQKLDYIHNNPLQDRWKLCERAEDYKYSSARYYLCNIEDWNFLTHYIE